MKPQYPALVKLSCIVTYAKFSVCHLCGDVTTEYVYKLYELGYAVTQAYCSCILVSLNDKHVSLLRLKVLAMQGPDSNCMFHTCMSYFCLHREALLTKC